ncbi:BCD family MFS transporter [Roseospira visakhapatnamensis]|uniref:BCD family chlorophyll transporter-like MFS transporter n=1 Tax=Roseospira visakhapatnamensis TaxID=390880 RepID=A0A7W6REX2_9PROT|nr:BCD family MFS transporter [Roseospira visakhapatnamensis]MBB4267203.1 BCD family chlorophyll transporter-like MFS transporter [Roseospira visakhapatnamensis]
MTSTASSLGWIAVARLGLVQASLGAMIVLTTSTFNRVMAVELAMAASVPGALVALREVLQFLRPRWGHGSDVGGRRTPWIIGGMGVLALGVFGAGLSTAWMSTNMTAGLTAAALSYVVIGIGVGAGGTNLLALLAKQVAPARRAPAATIVWLMMFVGFIVSTITAGAVLDVPEAVAGATTAAGDSYSPERLVWVTGGVCLVAFLVSVLAVWGVETSPGPAAATARQATPKPSFLETLRDVWREDNARRFALFVFLSMFAYTMQDLILEPFAGVAFGFTVGESTRLTATQQMGAVAGMVLVGILASRSWLGGGHPSALKLWTIGGCVASALTLGGLAVGSQIPGTWSLTVNVALMGLATGGFTVAAVSSMMGLAGAGTRNREGIRMGVWGLAQAMAFATGGFVGTVAVDASRLVLTDPASAYGAVFAVEGVLFLVAAVLAARVGAPREAEAPAGAPVLSAVAERELHAG